MDYFDTGLLSYAELKAFQRMGIVGPDEQWQHPSRWEIQAWISDRGGAYLIAILLANPGLLRRQ